VAVRLEDSGKGAGGLINSVMHGSTLGGVDDVVSPMVLGRILLRVL
jgi:hypothetical protein